MKANEAGSQFASNFSFARFRYSAIAQRRTDSIDKEREKARMACWLAGWRLGGENSEKSFINTRCNNDCESSIDDWKLKEKLAQTHANELIKGEHFSVVVRLSPPSKHPLRKFSSTKKRKILAKYFSVENKNFKLLISFTISHVNFSFSSNFLFTTSQIIAKHFSLACTEKKGFAILVHTLLNATPTAE